MEQLSFEKAKRLSIKKWEMHVNADGLNFSINFDTELKSLKNRCGFCERWKNENLDFGVYCESCEFGKIAGICECRHGNLFSIWVSKPSKENAQKILDVLNGLTENK